MATVKNLAMIWRPGHGTFWHAVCSLGCLIELNCYDSFHVHSFTPFFNGTMITYDKHLCEKKATTVPPNAEGCTQCIFFPPTMRGSSLHRHGPGHGANELTVGLVPENRGFPLQRHQNAGVSMGIARVCRASRGFCTLMPITRSW